MGVLTDDLWEYAKKEYEKLEFGEIRIIANETSKGIDVIVEKRKRFTKENIDNSKKIFNQG